MTALETERFNLRPIRHEDIDDVIQVLSSDPEVVKGLAHDGSDPVARREHAEGWIQYGPDGNAAMWRDCGLALFVITDRTATYAPQGEFMGVCGVTIERDGGKWHGELIYALGSRYHGHGIISEAASAVVARFRSQPDAGSLHAAYWRILNPASGRILRRLGFENTGVRPLLDEFGAERLRGTRRFELWRLQQAEPRQRPGMILAVAIKLGHLASAGISDQARNRDDLFEIVREGDWAEDLAPVIDAGLQAGFDHPGMDMMQLDVH